jgi:hypothetical protein
MIGVVTLLAACVTTPTLRPTPTPATEKAAAVVTTMAAAPAYCKEAQKYSELVKKGMELELKAPYLDAEIQAKVGFCKRFPEREKSYAIITYQVFHHNKVILLIEQVAFVLLENKEWNVVNSDVIYIFKKEEAPTSL